MKNSIRVQQSVTTELCQDARLWPPLSAPALPGCSCHSPAANVAGSCQEHWGDHRGCQEDDSGDACSWPHPILGLSCGWRRKRRRRKTEEEGKIGRHLGMCFCRWRSISSPQKTATSWGCTGGWRTGRRTGQKRGEEAKEKKESGKTWMKIFFNSTNVLVVLYYASDASRIRKGIEEEKCLG